MPDWKAYARTRLARLRTSPARESDIVAEISVHLEQAYSDALARGASEAEALRQADAWFANWSEVEREISTEESLAGRSAPSLIGGWSGDFRYALRLLLRNPAFAVIAVMTLAFGIGANTAIFSMAGAIALRDLPYSNPSQLMAIETKVNGQSEIEAWTSAPDFIELRKRVSSFSSIAGISPVWSDILTTPTAAEHVEDLYVSSTFFPTLGVRPALGRSFTANEDASASSAQVVMLSYPFWQSHFGGSPDALGKTLVVNGAPFTIVGALPADFVYVGEPLLNRAANIEIWLPLAANPLATQPASVRFLKLIGRRKNSISPEQASSEIASLGNAISAAHAAGQGNLTYGAAPLRDRVQGPMRGPVWLLLFTAGFVLLMACANVASLLLARAASRRSEIAVRMALGATRFRLLRQLLAEGLVLSTIGGIAGVAFAKWGVAVLARLAPAQLTHAYAFTLDWRALVFAGASVILATLGSGLPAAWNVASNAIRDGLNAGARGMTQGAHRVRSAMVAIELAAALVLLVGAGLAIRSFQRLLDVNPGFDSSGLITATTLTPPGAVTPQQRGAIYEALRQHLLATPGVSSVDAVTRLPFSGGNLGTTVNVEGVTRPGDPPIEVEYRRSTPGYFATMRIPLLRGRFLNDHDNGAAVVVNRAFEKRFWPTGSAIGKRFKGEAAEPWSMIVGVVGDVHHFGLDAEVRPEVHRGYNINPFFTPILVIRTSGDAAALMSGIAAKVRAVDASMPVYNIFPMQQLVERSTAQRRFLMWLLTGFAATALLLAAVGVYGAVSQMVARRSQEIGLRMALGASPREALLLVFGDGMRLAAIGIAAGAIAAAGLTRLMQGVLFEVQALDPLAFAGAALVLAAVGALACYVPARSATRVDPVNTLRG